MKTKLPKWAEYIFFAVLYLTFFSLFFSPFIEQNLLPGRVDAWFNLGIFKHYGNIIDSFFSGEPLFIPNYPEGKVFLYGEPSFLSGVLFWLINKFFVHDLKAYIAFYVAIHTLNSISFGLFLKNHFQLHSIITFIAGLLFSCAAFNLAFYDNVVYSIWFPIFFSLYFLQKALNGEGKKHFALAALLLSTQIYFSVYNFFMGILIIGIYVLLMIKNEKKSIIALLLSITFISLLIFPFIYLYVIHSKIPDSFHGYITLK